MTTLQLALKAEYFDAIRDGHKVEEFRLCTPYWDKRLMGNEFDKIVLTKGYPSRDDASRRIEKPYRGFVRKTITHPHFGPDAVEVYAINVAASPLPSQEG